MLMGAHDGAVDHRDALWHQVARGQSLQHGVPDTGKRPAAELAMDTTPIAEALMKIAPRRSGSCDPDDAVENPPMIRRRRPLLPPLALTNGAKNAHSSSLINPRTIAASKRQRGIKVQMIWESTLST